MKYLAMLYTLGLALFLQGCAVAIPVHQLNSPQSLGSMTLNVGAISGTSPAVGPEGTDGSNLATLRTEDLNQSNLLMGYHLSWGITDSIDVEGELMAAIPSGSMTTIGLKYQWLGSNYYSDSIGWNSAIKIKGIFGSGFKDDENEDGEDTLFDDVFVEKMDSEGFSVALPFGYRAARWFMVYLGPQYITSTLDYRYRDDNSTGTLYEGKRTIDGYGGFLGMQFNTTGSFFRFAYNVEFEKTNLPSTHSSEDVWYDSIMSSLMFTFNFN